MKKVKDVIWISLIALGILLLVGWTVWQNVRIFERNDNTVRSTSILDGEYSIDGGDWKPVDNTKPINEHFHKIVFKGRLNDAVTSDVTTMMHIASKNVWYTMYISSGDVVVQYRRKL